MQVSGRRKLRVRQRAAKSLSSSRIGKTFERLAPGELMGGCEQDAIDIENRCLKLLKTAEGCIAGLETLMVGLAASCGAGR